MSKPYPVEFRHDVVAVARKHESPLAQVAKDFGSSRATLHNWLRKADIEDWIAPGTPDAEADEIQALKKRMRLLEQENEVLRRAAAYLSQACRFRGAGYRPDPGAGTPPRSCVCCCPRKCTGATGPPARSAARTPACLPGGPLTPGAKPTP